MPTLLADTGNGATLTQTGTVTEVVNFFSELKVRRIEFPEVSNERIDASYLGSTTYREYIPADLTDPPSLTVTCIFETSVSMPAAGDDMGTITVTYPLRTGEVTAATYAGTGNVGAVTMPSIANGEVMECTIRVDFDGGTGPTFTKAA